MIHSSAFNQYVSGATASLHTLALYLASHSMHNHLRHIAEKTLLRTYFNYRIGLHYMVKIPHCSSIACAVALATSLTRHMGGPFLFLLFQGSWTIPVMPVM